MANLDLHNFTFNGVDFEIRIDRINKGGDDFDTLECAIHYLNKGLQERATVILMPTSFLANPFICTYKVDRINSEDINIIESTREGRFRVEKKQFWKFFMSATGSTEMGIILARNMINGMTMKESPDKIVSDVPAIMGFEYFANDMTPNTFAWFNYTVIDDVVNTGKKSIALEITEGLGGHNVQYFINGLETDLGEVSQIDNIDMSVNMIVKLTNSNGIYIERPVFTGL